MSDKVINIIGNNNSGNAISDGGRIKIRLYKSLLEEHGFKVNIIDLHNWKRRIFNILKKIKMAIHRGENIVIMAGPNGSRFIIPYVWRKNRRKNSNIVFCPVGIGTIDAIVRKLSNDKLNDFLLSRDFGNKKDKKFSKYLSSFKRVVLENKVLENCYRKFYGIKNTSVLTNFRVFDSQTSNTMFCDNNLHCVYVSRVCIEKGILDLVKSVNDINQSSKDKVCLDVFGDIQLNEKDKEYFLNSTNDYVRYCGVIEQNQSIVSNYSQSKELITDGYNGYSFEMNNSSDLKNKLLNILSDKSGLLSIRENVKESSKKFIFKYVKNDFYRLIGDAEE